MKTKFAFAVAVASAMAIASPAAAQTFSGTNAPNTGTNFSFTVGAGATNLSLVISNSATAYSHLYLKRGGPAAQRTNQPNQSGTAGIHRNELRAPRGHTGHISAACIQCGFDHQLADHA